MPAATGGFQCLETFLHLFPKKFFVRPLTSVKPANAGQGTTRKDVMNKERWITSLVKRYERPLCSYAFSLLRDLERARDAVQDTFLRLCGQKPEKLRGREAPWLFRVCRNRSLDILRKEKPVQPMSDPQEATLATQERSPDEEAAQGDLGRLLPRFLIKLPKKQQEVIRLKFQQQLSYREIAHSTQLSESNVGYLLHTGIKTLRDQMINL